MSTEHAEQVAQDIYLIEEPIREDWFCGVVVVLGKQHIGLVDTGFEHTPGRYVFPFLESLGRRPEEITLIVNTHRDGDHVQGNRPVKDRSDAAVAAHELEREAIGEVDRVLQDGDRVQMGDRTFTVLHTPGHTTGSICLHDEANGILLTGDALCGELKELIRMAPEIYIRSLEKLGRLKANTVVMAHPFPPAGKGILNAEEASRMIRDSTTVARNL